MDKPLLSLCIAEYGKGERTAELVKEMLKYDSKEIEVVVVDDCSKDNSLEILSAIHDERFIYQRNTSNIGAVKNWIEVFRRATGRFVLYFNDRDLVNINELPNFLGFLGTNVNLGGGHIQASNGTSQFEIFAQGEESLKRFAYRSAHPTGYFFNREFITDLISNLDIYTVDRVGLFPYDFLIAETAVLHPFAEYYREVWKMAESQFKAVNKSGVEKNNDETIWFFWKEREMQLERCIRHIDTLEIPEKLKVELIRNCIMRYYKFATWTYKGITQNKTACDHYRYTCDKVTVRMTLNYGKNFLNTLYTHFYISQEEKMMIDLKIQTMNIAQILKTLYIGLRSGTKHE